MDGVILETGSSGKLGGVYTGSVVRSKPSGWRRGLEEAEDGGWVLWSHSLLAAWLVRRA